MTTHNTKKDNALVVVAIDLGTTYSGWAYSFRKDFKQDQDKIYTFLWKSNEGGATVKTPTAILFDQNDKFHSFGYKAESKYVELLEDEEADNWKYFTRFKMALFNDERNEYHDDMRKMATRKVSRKQELKDVTGKKLPSLTVFAETIQYLKNHFLQTVQERASFVGLDDIHWVVTIPAIWSDEAKQFMRMASNKAGINDEMLSLAYEPEAAAIFCKNITIHKGGNDVQSDIGTFDVGEQILVLDCGGGTVDVTAYKVIHADKLEETSPPTGGPRGGTEVDKEYLQLIKKIFGENVWTKFEKKHPTDALEFKRTFEAKKRVIGENNETYARMFCPNALFETYKLINSSEFTSTLGITRKHDKLKIPIEVLTNLFEKPLTKIVKHVQGILQQEKTGFIRTILMVGGFSDSVLLYHRIKNNFTGIRVLRPAEAVSSVVKGAVLFGHTPKVIYERTSPRTYGVSCNIPFDRSIHQPRFLGIYDGREMCTDIFNAIVRKGDSVIVGRYYECTCLPAKASDTEATVDIYSSTDADPKYTAFSDTVKMLGTLTLSIPDTHKGKNRPIRIKLTFDGTELSVTAVEVGTGNEVSGKFNCLK